MANDSRFVLAQLVRSGIWSNLGNVFCHKHFVLDADSVATYLYKQCLKNHLKREKALKGRSKSGRRADNIDYYAATIVNYREFGQYVEQLLDFFAAHSIELHVVYRGKCMEAPLFGLLPAQIKKNTQRASEALNLLIDYNNSSNNSSNNSNSNNSTAGTSIASLALSSAISSNGGVPKSIKHKTRKEFSLELYMSQLRPSRPNLALNVFKQVVNERRKRASRKWRLKTHQAYYSPFPILAKLARDLACPVLTNDGDFIIMDVRAGFVLFDDFFRTYLVTQNVMSRCPSVSSVNSRASSSNSAKSPRSRSSKSASRNRLVVSPKSPAVGLSDTKSLFQQPSHASQVRFHLNSLFLRQHPGLNQSLVLQLFPLTTGEFIVAHAKSMTKMRIYDREFKEQDLISVAHDLDARTSAKKYHMAAGRLEMVSRYLCTKEPVLLESLLKGEAHRLLASGSTFDEDYKELFNYYAVAYDFKNRLKLVLKHVADANQLSYIEACLLDRESTADYLLSLLPCAIGKISSITYNKSMQFEDLKARSSGFAMLDRGKRMLMSLLSGNKMHKNEHSTSLQAHEREKISARFKTASLTVVDREHQKLAERTLATSVNIKLPAQLSLATLAKGTASKEFGTTFLELTFNQPAGCFVRLTSDKVARLLQASSQQQDQTRQLAILLNLHRFSLGQAAQEDAYFKENYLKLSVHFELALASHFIHINHLGTSRHLVDLITKFDLENVARFSFEQKISEKSAAASRAAPASSLRHAKSQKREPKAQVSEAPIRRQIRHLIELLNSSLEAYLELNSFLNYPLPHLNLSQSYNPILLFNLTLHSVAAEHQRE